MGCAASPSRAMCPYVPGERCPVQHRPPSHVGHRVEKVADHRDPTSELPPEVRRLAGRRPRLDRLSRRGRGERHDVIAACGDRRMHQVTAGAAPRCPRRSPISPRWQFAGDRRPPGVQPAVACRDLARGVVPYSAVNPVDRDERVSLRRRAVGEGHRNVARTQFQADTAVIQANRSRGHRAHQHIEQIGPMGEPRGSVMKFLAPRYVLREQDPAVLPAPELPASAHLQRASLKGVHEAELVQEPDGVGPSTIPAPSGRSAETCSSA